MTPHDEANDSDMPVHIRPVDVSDDARFPNIAAARRHWHSLPPERKARIEREFG